MSVMVLPIMTNTLLLVPYLHFTHLISFLLKNTTHVIIMRTTILHVDTDKLRTIIASLSLHVFI